MGENTLNIPGNANAGVTEGDESSAMTSGSGYDVTMLQYPEDLGSTGSIYGGNRVIFFINIPGASKIAQDDTDGKITMGVPKSRYLDVSGQRIEQIKKNIDSKSIRVLAPKKRLKTAISLYVPEALVKSYSVNWEEASSEEMMMGDIAAQATLAASSAMPGSSTSGMGEGARLAKTVGTASLAARVNGMKYAQKASGVTPGNSKAQLLFNRVDFNTFTFDYRFAPKSSSEARKVLEIIRTFRHHMLPEFLDSEQYLYIYPSEFEIRYFKNTSENEFLEHHITSVLTNMTINYNPNGQYTTFKDGMPTHINLSLTFKELGVPTKETSPYNKSGA